MTATEIAALFGLEPFTIRNWSTRHPDLVPQRGKRAGRVLYRVGDVSAYRTRVK